MGYCLPPCPPRFFKLCVCTAVTLTKVSISATILWLKHVIVDSATCKREKRFACVLAYSFLRVVASPSFCSAELTVPEAVR